MVPAWVFLPVLVAWGAQLIVAKRAPQYFRWLAIRLGKSIRIPLPDEARGTLLDVGDAADYRASPGATLDWTRVDKEAFEQLVGDQATKVSFDAQRRTVTLVPRRMYGRNRWFWVAIVTIDVEGGEIVLTPRYYFDVLNVLVILFLSTTMHLRPTPGVIIGATLVVTMILANLRTLSSLPYRVASKVMAFFQAPRVRVAQEDVRVLPSGDEPDVVQSPIENEREGAGTRVAGR